SLGSARSLSYPHPPRGSPKRPSSTTSPTAAMFSRSFRSQDQARVDKSARLKKAHREPSKHAKLQRSFTDGASSHSRGTQRARAGSASVAAKSLAPAPIVTLAVGREGRLF